MRSGHSYSMGTDFQASAGAFGMSTALITAVGELEDPIQRVILLRWQAIDEEGRKRYGRFLRGSRFRLLPRKRCQLAIQQLLMATAPRFTSHPRMRP